MNLQLHLLLEGYQVVFHEGFQMENRTSWLHHGGLEFYDSVELGDLKEVFIQFETALLPSFVVKQEVSRRCVTCAF